jgi:Flp pilus assembly protein TadD
MIVKSQVLLFLTGLALAAPRSSFSQNKSQPFNETGTLMEMEAVPCGIQERGFTGIGGLLVTAGLEHVNSNDKLCQEYVLRTAYIQYRIRPVNEKEPVLLPVGEKAHFHLKGDHIVLSMPEGDDKVREYKVVGMKPLTTDDSSASRVANAKIDGTRPVAFGLSPTDNVPRLERRPLQSTGPDPVASSARLSNNSSLPNPQTTAQSSASQPAGWVAAGAVSLAAGRSRLALDRVQLLALIAGGVPSPRVAMLLDERELSFTPDVNYLASLQAAGATDDLIKTLNVGGGTHVAAAPGSRDTRVEQDLARGAQLAHSGRLDQAGQEYRKAQQLQPQDPSLHFASGYALARQGKWKEAAAEYQAIAAANPDDPAAHSNLGVALNHAGDREGAIREYRRGLALDPESAAMHQDLGDVLEGKGDWAGAAAELRQAVQERGLDAALHADLGAVLLRQKDLDGAIREDRQAISLQGACCQAQYDLATALDLKGDLKGAVENLRDVLSSEPDDAQAHAALAGILDRQGDTNEALAHYKIALLLKPQDAEIQAARDALINRVGSGGGQVTGQ